MSDWQETTLGDVLNFQRGHDITRATQRDSTVPVVSSGGIGSYHDTAAAKAPGVVIGRKGTLGKVSICQTIIGHTIRPSGSKISKVAIPASFTTS